MKFKFGFSPAEYGGNDFVGEPEAHLGIKKKIFEAILTNVVVAIEQATNTRVLKGADLRTFDRVLRAVDSAQSEEVEIETAEAELLKKLLNHAEASVPTVQVRSFARLQDSIDEALGAKR